MDRIVLPEPSRRPRRLVYLGTPEVAVPPLVALHDAGFEIPLVVTRPDKRRGRGSSLVPSPVKAAAEELGLTVADGLAAIDELTPPVDAEHDVGVVVAYGRIIPTELLARLPMLNLHFSLLPRWRGAAPVERAILAGDAETGVCLMQIAPELDVGDVYRCERIPIVADDTLDGLRGRLVDLGAAMLVEELQAGLGPATPQDGEVTYAAKIEPEEHRLDVARSAAELHRVVRLGRAWCTFRDRRLRILDAEPVTDRGDTDPGSGAASGVGDPEPGVLDGDEVVTGDGRLRLLVVQPEGKKPMAAAAWRNGVRPEPGERLG